MNFKDLFAAAPALALALAACGPSPEETITEDVDGSDLTGVPANQAGMATGDAEIFADGQQFVSMAAANDLYEIEAGKLAQQNGTSQAVKDFGAMMERDHTKSAADLRAAANQAQDLNRDPQMTAQQRSDLEALRSAGDDFDSTYARQQVAAHQQALAMLRSHAENGEMQPLKEFAAKTAPVIERHLNEARRLR